MRRYFLVSLLLAILLSNQVLAIEPVYSGGRERAAIRGFDAVAYFTEHKAIKGNKAYAFDYLGATWLFSSQENRDRFAANPASYAPQYGGYCAYAVSRNTTASIKPEYFTIYDGKLYLNYSRSVMKKWTKHKQRYIEEANLNWPNLAEK
ncbi:hypothetical protein GCM10008090_32760 [Arenicella chitinivorans]|uniref:YHS domain-containing protein n=1 Tax=Arenicella chitinivorans TaxID=1329800 RepID=A0A918S3Y9_9GAMM|nr:YHS domain-containing (seleno)protein [Arenicella chitinivorans]GHA20246.1 hypothetical protein GCM10008090_32760 [Arenicella chitinivorans]